MEKSHNLDRCHDGMLTLLMGYGAIEFVEDYIQKTHRSPTGLSYTHPAGFNLFNIQHIPQWYVSSSPTNFLGQALLFGPDRLESSAHSLLHQKNVTLFSRSEVLEHCLNSPTWSSVLDLSSPCHFQGQWIGHNKDHHYDTLWNMVVCSSFEGRGGYDEYIDFLSTLHKHNAPKVLPNYLTEVSPLNPLASFIHNLRFTVMHPSSHVPQTQKSPVCPISNAQALLQDFLNRSSAWRAPLGDHDQAYSALLDLLPHLNSRFVSLKQKLSLFETLQKYGVALSASPQGLLEDSPLFKTVLQAEGDLACWMTKHGASATHVCPKTKNTLALAGCVNDKTFQAFERISKSFASNVDHKNKAGEAPLHHATKALSQKMVNLLLSLNADPNVCDNKGRFPHQLSGKVGLKTQKRWDGILKDLKKAGAKELTGLDYLKQGCMTLSLDLVKKGIELGVSPSCTFDKGKTPLHLVLPAIRTRDLKKATPLLKRQEAIVDYLLQQGANPNAQEKEEKNTPLHICVDRGLIKCAQLLFDHGAQNTIVNKYNSKPSQMFTSFAPVLEDDYQQSGETQASKQLFEVFCSYGVPLNDKDFLRISHTPEYQAMLLKHQINQALPVLGSDAASIAPFKRKM